MKDLPLRLVLVDKNNRSPPARVDGRDELSLSHPGPSVLTLSPPPQTLPPLSPASPPPFSHPPPTDPPSSLTSPPQTLPPLSPCVSPLQTPLLSHLVFPHRTLPPLSPVFLSTDPPPLSPVFLPHRPSLLSHLCVSPLQTLPPLSPCVSASDPPSSLTVCFSSTDPPSSLTWVLSSQTLPPLSPVSPSRQTLPPLSCFSSTVSSTDHVYPRTPLSQGNRTCCCVWFGLLSGSSSVLWTLDEQNLSSFSVSQAFLQEDGSFYQISRLEMVPEEDQMYSCSVEHVL
ncbi:hypothetical protein WMY93_033981 [Mugilogobius chulae]|uniref:Ig-like domain-containing protein n=1 Tax=Mugilogobius chulae TaxID=88201 RepID=A0AAW0MFT9_9GOBI